MRLEHKLCGLANEKLSIEELLFGVDLISVLYFPRSLAYTRYLKELELMLDVTHAISTVLIK